MNPIIATGKSILNALAFANVNRIDELQSKLNHFDVRAHSSAAIAQIHLDSAFNQASFAPSVGHIQGAL